MEGKPYLNYRSTNKIKFIVELIEKLKKNCSTCDSKIYENSTNKCAINLQEIID